jgi:hypothetical protein
MIRTGFEGYVSARAGEKAIALTRASVVPQMADTARLIKPLKMTAEHFVGGRK